MICTFEIGSVLDTSNSSKNITINSNVSDPPATQPKPDLRFEPGDLVIAGSVGTAGNRLDDILI